MKTNNDFEIVVLKFEDFHQMVDGQINPNEVSLKENDIKTFGLVSKELNHLAAILHVYAGGLNFMK